MVDVVEELRKSQMMLQKRETHFCGKTTILSKANLKKFEFLNTFPQFNKIPGKKKFSKFFLSIFFRNFPNF